MLYFYFSEIDVFLLMVKCMVFSVEIVIQGTVYFSPNWVLTYIEVGGGSIMFTETIPQFRTT